MFGGSALIRLGGFLWRVDSIPMRGTQLFSLFLVYSDRRLRLEEVPLETSGLSAYNRCRLHIIISKNLC